MKKKLYILITFILCLFIQTQQLCYSQKPEIQFVNQQSETVDFPINSADDITVSPGGDIVVTGPDGQTETFPGGKDTVITDSTGKSYYVDAEGNVSGAFDQADGGKPTPENTDGVDKNGEVTALTAEGIKVTFEKINNETKYAFDLVTYGKELTKDYKKVDGLFVPFKAVPNGLSDKILAKVTLSGTNVVTDSLFFKTQNGMKIDAVKEGKHFVLTLKGAQKFAVEEVQATIKQGNKYKIAGVFNLVHVSPRTVKLKLVPTSSSINVSDKIDEIKAVYNQLAINVQVEVEEKPFKIDDYLEPNGSLPTENEFGDLSTYSTAQKAIINDFTKERNPEQAYYIFVTNAASSTGQDGYMALGNQFGFVFNQSAKTIAHEFGHGALRLEHPFKQYKNKGLNKGDTQSIIDYAGGTELLFTDWKQINDPKFRLYAFQGQSEGELWGEVWINPLGEPFKLENTNKDLIYLNGGTAKGSVAGYFVDVKGKDRQFFKWNKPKNAYTLNGDDNGSKDTQYYALQKPKDDDLINLYLEDGGCGKDKYYRATYKYVKAHFTVTDGIKFSDSNNIKYVGNITCESDTKTNEQFFVEITLPILKDVQYVKEKEISEDRIQVLVDAVNAAIQKPISSYTYSKASSKSDLRRITIDDGIDLDFYIEKLSKLDHKLVYLSEYTNPLASQTQDIYVVYHKIDYFISNGWNEIAKRVFEKSNLSNKNAVLVLIPYFEFKKERHFGVNSNFSHYMPGVYAKGVQIETSNIGKLPATDLSTTYYNDKFKAILGATTIDFVNRIYTQTYKPAEIFYGAKSFDGTVSNSYKKVQEYKPGANAIKFVLLKENIYYDIIINLNKPQQTYQVRTGDGPDTRINENYHNELLIYQITKAGLEDEARASLKEASSWKTVNSDEIIEFKEKFLNEEVAEKYINNYAYRSKVSQFITDLGEVYGGVTNQLPEVYNLEHTYNKSAGEIVDKAVYGTLDVVSFLYHFLEQM